MAEWMADRPGEAVVNVETAVGRLLLPQADLVITPTLSKWKIWEPELTWYLQVALRPGDTFVDVGAHVGYFTVLAGRLVGAGGRVIAVEPEARNLDLLRRNLARNDCEAVQVIPFAAGGSDGWMALALDEENRGGHRLVDPSAPDAGPPVRCVRLDEVLPARVDVIKIDAQGHDHEVIGGLARTLAANPSAVVIAELSRTELARRGIDPEVVLASYEESGFVLQTIDPFGRARKASVQEIMELSNTNAEMELVLDRSATVHS